MTIATGWLRGYRTLTLGNDRLDVVVLPDRGAEIHQIVHRPTGTTFLMEVPGGLPPPGPVPRAHFLDGYAGGWQELFPNVNEACRVGDVELPFHGEVTLRPWDVREESTDGDELVLATLVESLGVRLERRMRLVPGTGRLEIDGTIANQTDSPAQVAWGHHIVLGGTFLRASCRMDLAGAMIETPAELYEPSTATLAPGQAEPWPYALGLDGRRIDLRDVPGPEEHSHDDIFLTDIAEGRVRVSDPERRLALTLEWERDVFGCLVNWRPLGGADEPPLTGVHGLGIEPWTSPRNLAEAMLRDEALRIGPRASRSTRLLLTVESP